MLSFNLNDIKARRTRKPRFGFTLVELLIVVLIVGILAAVAIPIYLGIQDGARKSVLAEDVRQTNQNIQIAILEGTTTSAQVIATAGAGYISNSDPSYATITVGGSGAAGAVGAIAKSDSSVNSSLSTSGFTSAQLADTLSSNYYAISGALTNGYTYSYDQYSNKYVNNGATVAASGSTSTSTSAAPTATAPSITSSKPTATAAVGTAYSYTVVATGTPSTITYSATGLPTSLSIGSSSGIISGTPTATGTFTYTITASNGTTPNAQQSGSIVVSPASTTPAFTSAAVTATGSTGTAYSYTVTASGYPTPTFGIASGTLPAGINLNPTSGLLSGTPTAAGTYNFVINASNGVGTAPTQNETIVITAPTVLANYDFESGITGMIPGSGTLSQATNIGGHTAVLKVTGTGNQSGFGPLVTVTAGKSYTYTADLYVAAPTSNFNAYIYGFGGIGTNVTTANTWVPVTFTVTAGVTAGRMDFEIDDTSGTQSRTVTAYIDNMKLVQNN